MTHKAALLQIRKITKVRWDCPMELVATDPERLELWSSVVQRPRQCPRQLIPWSDASQT